ncbi:MAG: response regulator transcription factor [Aminobacterium sp.]|uniref:response regulator transcription factor n=1 Tax=Aminobacterium sp. TaxID=1872491 RepID=UPI002B20546B|nr:response regulator transcription factor [Aminobacterium sp.]MEA4877439.1 response regulator transcription factor [Aminobacterium sp.]
MGKITVVIADDHNLFRESVRKVLDMESDIEVIGEARDGQETIEVVERMSPQIVMLDIRMPKLDGIEVVNKLREKGVNCAFVIITALDGENQITRVSRAGIQGYVLKSSGLAELLTALRIVASGGRYVDPQIASKLLSSFSPHAEFKEKIETLTLKEKQILYWISHGLSSREVAKRMILSNKTVQNHMSQILKKLEVQEKGQAVALAWKWGLPEHAPSEIMDSAGE